MLLQQGKGADVGAAFGSGSSNTMFGSSGGATFMTRVTTWLAVGFFVIAFGWLIPLKSERLPRVKSVFLRCYASLRTRNSSRA